MVFPSYSSWLSLLLRPPSGTLNETLRYRDYMRSGNLGTENLIFISEYDWTVPAQILRPQIDSKLLYACFQKTLVCWLGLELLEFVDQSKIKPPYGWDRKQSKITDELKWRFFTPNELRSIYFLIWLDFFSVRGGDKLDRFCTYFNQIKVKEIPSPISSFLIDLQRRLSSESGNLDFLIAREKRSRRFLLENGFSHIRVDLLTGKIRLCPPHTGIDLKAALRPEDQPQEDIGSEKTELDWVNKFGAASRGYYEIAIDHRLKQFYDGKKLKDFRPLNSNESRVNESAPKYGVVLMPSLADIHLSFSGIYSLI